MTNESIIKQAEAGSSTDKTSEHSFQQRVTIRGLFVKGEDYNDLKSKNLNG